jgi:hypothetical protein
MPTNLATMLRCYFRGSLTPHFDLFCTHYRMGTEGPGAAPIGGSSRGRAKRQVALRDGLQVGLRTRLAEFTAGD